MIGHLKYQASEVYEGKLISTYPSLGAFWVSMEELSNVGHDGLLVGSLHVHVLRIQQPGNAKLRVSNLNRVG